MKKFTFQSCRKIVLIVKPLSLWYDKNNRNGFCVIRVWIRERPVRIWQNWTLRENMQRICRDCGRFRLLDDDFMSKVFEDKACVQFLLQIILNRKDLNVQKVHAQHDVKNLQGRSIRLDIIAIDGNGRVYNIEIQRSDKGASIKRARYNSSLLDANVTEPGDDYENLTETYVIFITENDVLKAGLPIYHIDRTIKETGEMFGDEAHIIYVNSQIKDETELGKLMHDFSCTDAKGVEAMCRAMEDMRKEAVAEDRLKTLRNLMKNLGLAAEQALAAMGVSESDKGILIKKL